MQNRKTIAEESLRDKICRELERSKLDASEGNILTVYHAQLDDTTGRSLHEIVKAVAYRLKKK